MSCDILRQLNCYSSLVYIEYLSERGIDRTPATREGTVGRKLWDILVPGLKKEDWTPSTASYSDKLNELQINMGYLYITANVENEQSYNAIPDVQVFICLDEGPDISAEQLTHMFTIDNVIPNISEIHHLRYL